MDPLNPSVLIRYLLPSIKREWRQEFSLEETELLTARVLDLIVTNNDYETLTVEKVQDYVESVLLESTYKKTAKAFIIYREKRSQARRPDIFKFRLNLKPYEYPELAKYKESIQHSYWLHTEFNYTSDIQDFMVNVSEGERSVIKNAMLAIAQVEVAVKTFWGDLYHKMQNQKLVRLVTLSRKVKSVIMMPIPTF